MSDGLPPPEIHDRGRGPEIKGSRITVFDVLDYHLIGATPESIAEQFRLTPEHIREAIRYIGANRDEVIAAYNQILQRAAAGNPPEVQAKLDIAHQKFQAMMAERKQRRESEAQDEGDPVRH